MVTKANACIIHASAPRRQNRRQKMLPVRAVLVLVCAVVCFSGCVTRTVSRTPRLSETESGKFNADGKVVEEPQTIWFWQR